MYQIILSLKGQKYLLHLQKYLLHDGNRPLVWADTGVRGVRAAVRHSTQGSSHPAAARATYTAQNKKIAKQVSLNFDSWNHNSIYLSKFKFNFALILRGVK